MSGAILNYECFSLRIKLEWSARSLAVRLIISMKIIFMHRLKRWTLLWHEVRIHALHANNIGNVSLVGAPDSFQCMHMQYYVFMLGPVRFECFMFGSACGLVGVPGTESGGGSCGGKGGAGEGGVGWLYPARLAVDLYSHCQRRSSAYTKRAFT